MGKWPVPIGGILFLRLQKGPRRSDFQGVRLLSMPSLKKMSTNGQGGGDKKNKNLDREVHFLPIFGRFLAIFRQKIGHFWPKNDANCKINRKSTKKHRGSNYASIES